MFNDDPSPNERPRTNGDVQHASHLGAAIAQHTGNLHRDAVLVPEGYSLEDTERFQDKPRRVERHVEARTLDGLLQYLERYAREETIVSVDPMEGDVKVIFDYHTHDGDARWCDHVCTYAPERSEQLKKWKRKSGTLMSQRDFALHIEEHVEDIAEPDAGQMLELAQNVQATRDVEFQSGQRLSGSDDVQFHYEETTTASAGSSGEMTMPESMALGIPVHQGGEPFKIDVRLRWQIGKGGLQLGYKLLRLDDVERTAAGDIVNAVSDAADNLGVPVLEVAL